MKALQWKGTYSITPSGMLAVNKNNNNKKLNLNLTMRKQSGKSTLEKFCKTTGWTL